MSGIPRFNRGPFEESHLKGSLICTLSSRIHISNSQKCHHSQICNLKIHNIEVHIRPRFRWVHASSRKLHVTYCQPMFGVGEVTIYQCIISTLKFKNSTLKEGERAREHWTNAKKEDYITHCCNYVNKYGKRQNKNCNLCHMGIKRRVILWS